MKTITYNEVLYRAAEAAGRVRTALPVAEATMLKSILAMELRSIWRMCDWNELIPNPLLVTVTNAAFSKNEGSTDEAAPELGDILGVYTGNPRDPAQQSYELAFDEGDNTVRLRPPEPSAPAWPWWWQLLNGAMPAEVYVEYMLPCPDLLAVAAVDLPAYELPEKFGPFLSARAAGHLLLADGATAMAGVQFGLAKSYQQDQEADITRPEWRWRLRVRK
jgi:hypothetical protein